MANNQEIKVYGDIGYKNNSSTLINTLTNLEKTGCKELTIRLHCYGGSVFEGNVMFNLLKSSQIKIKIVIDGIAAS
ncbi:MAG: ATP-dependent Clp protease proteolytic subunit, partial [Prolixibacteraceae bacterium]|nr:ATP-dependent Clp protease proteolytic subunit [Prolixibacteraceae bacterium]